ncbi:MAG: ATP-dependent Clp protease ATP-binding subunit [Clostridiales bacterium]|nr:ATP-dependent Clp protease ATP-binding subunit [Clostridiales bacterium]
MNFSNNSQEVLNIAEELAKRMGDELGTEHLLFGLVNVENTLAYKILTDCGFDKSWLGNMWQYLSAPARYNEVNVSTRVNRVLHEAKNMAITFGVSEIGTEHLLYCLLDERDSVAAQIFAAAGIDMTMLQKNTYVMIMRSMDARQGSAKVSEDLQNAAKPARLSSVLSDKCYTAPKKDDMDADLLKFGVDLTAKAREGRLDPVIGRGKETERVIQVLCRRTKNNPILIGEPGVGKSAVIDGLAQAIVNGLVPSVLRDKTLFSLDLTSLVAGTRYRGDFEQRLKTVLAEIKQRGDIILFIDEIHTILKAGSSEGGLDIANILKPMLARGELQTIGATTIEEYRKQFEQDSALERRFQPVNVEEPSPSETIEILYGLREKYEKHHGVTISDSAISAAAILSDRYVTDRFLPDKAIDLMDEAASRKNIYAFSTPQEIRDLEAKMKQADLDMSEAARKENFEKSMKLKELRNEYMEQLVQAQLEWKEKRANATLLVDEDDIAEVVCSWTGIPVSKITDGESEKLAVLEQALQQRVIGQNAACSAVARAVKRARAGLKDPKRPIGSFIFLGPTGVGKTELAKALAGALFGDDDMLIRVDMSEYMEKESVSRLIGSAPGLVGFEEGGQLTEKVRRKPYSVVLFDEIEKGHSDIYNLLLQILEDGILTDSHGRTVSFKNTVVILTSNIGSKEAEENRMQLGFIGAEQNENELERIKEKHIAALKNYMKPEIVNRIDEVIVFDKLGKDGLIKIADIMFSSLAKRLDERGMGLNITDEAKLFVVNAGYDPKYGARPLRRTIQRLIEDKLSEKLIAGEFADGDTIIIDAGENELIFGRI